MVNQRIAISIIIAAWLLVQLVAWQYFGVNTGVDTSQYVADAMAIMDGNWSAIELPLHLSYSLLLAVVVFVSGNFTNIVVIQLVVSLLAVLMLFRLTFAISGSNFSAFVAAILFVLWPDIPQWNFFVYTDSLFMNLVVISVALVYFSKRSVQYVFAAVLIVLTVFIRPVGVVFFLSLLVYLFRPRKYLALVFLVVGLITVNFVLRGAIDFFLVSYSKAEIIYPDVSLGIRAPGDLAIPDSNHQPLVRLLLFILSNPIYFLKIFFVKVALFVGHMKPYFSASHNLLIAIFLYPLYAMAVPGVMLMKQTALRNFAVSFIILQVMMVGLTSENWDGRFLLPLLPWVFILSSLGLTSILKNKTSWTLS